MPTPGQLADEVSEKYHSLKEKSPVKLTGEALRNLFDKIVKGVYETYRPYPKFLESYPKKSDFKSEISSILQERRRLKKLQGKKAPEPPKNSHDPQKIIIERKTGQTRMNLIF